MIPVAEDLRTFDFRQVPPAFEVVGERNAKGLNQDGGAELLESVCACLGLAAKDRLRQVFISYRRVDGTAAATEIEAYLWTQRCAAFLDTIQVEGGDPVQEVIMNALRDKDFVLFIDSPAAADSPWITAELNAALQSRIPVAVVVRRPAAAAPVHDGRQPGHGLGLRATPTGSARCFGSSAGASASARRWTTAWRGCWPSWHRCAMASCRSRIGASTS